VELRFAEVGPHRGIWQRDADGEVIVLDVALDRRARRCVLAHELVHAERGIGRPAASAATMEREEEAVRREVARRLVPPGLLASFVGSRAELDGTTAADVAEEFDVEIDVAVKALGLLGLPGLRPSAPPRRPS
jgi:hypothetical protein